MLNIDKDVLKAAAQVAQTGTLKAEDLHHRVRNLNLNLGEVSLALLHLRDEGLVVTEPTVGDPLDGHFAFRLTSQGLEQAANI